MQAALVTGKKEISLVEFDEPSSSDNHTVVAISYCGICGTDLHAFLSGEPYNPAICGHEWVGHVAAPSLQKNNFKEGDRVAIGVASACGSCSACLKGDGAHCESSFAGATGRGPNAPKHGGFAPAIAFPTDRLYHVPKELTDEQAGILEPATVAVHAMRRTEIRLGDTVVVIGAGPIGLLVAQCARLSGAGKLVVIEPEAGRRKLATQLGADITIDPTEEGHQDAIRDALGSGADVVFECAGIPATIQQAIEMSRRGGQVSLVGVANSLATINPALWMVQEIKLVSSIAYLHEDFEITKGLVADGRIDLETLHTSTVGLNEIQDAFDRLSSHPNEVKILVNPNA